VLNDELVSAGEQIDQPCGAVDGVELVGVDNLDHRQAPTLSAHQVLEPNEGLLLDEEPGASQLPLGARHDRRQWRLGVVDVAHQSSGDSRRHRRSVVPVSERVIQIMVADRDDPVHV
jgi:hypothetical protein